MNHINMSKAQCSTRCFTAVHIWQQQVSGG